MLAWESSINDLLKRHTQILVSHFVEKCILKIRQLSVNIISSTAKKNKHYLISQKNQIQKPYFALKK